MEVRTTKFTIAYDSNNEDSPLNKNEIDIEDLAQSLSGIGSVLIAANKAINHDQDMTVRVKSQFQPGSFGIPIELMQYVNSVDILPVIGFSSAAGHFALGGAMEVLRRLKGRKIDSLDPIDESKTLIKVENESIESSPRVCELVVNPSFRNAINKAFVSPVEQGKASVIKIYIEGFEDNPLHLKQEEIVSFKPSEEVYSKQVLTFDYTTTIQFLSAHAYASGSWMVEMYGAKKNVELLDKEFIARINSPNGNISFGKKYKVEVRETKTSRIGGRANRTFEIIKVYDNE